MKLWTYRDLLVQISLAWAAVADTHGCLLLLVQAIDRFASVLRSSNNGGDHRREGKKRLEIHLERDSN
jgi:hypothetical protein